MERSRYQKEVQGSHRGLSSCQKGNYDRTDRRRPSQLEPVSDNYNNNGDDIPNL